MSNLTGLERDRDHPCWRWRDNESDIDFSIWCKEKDWEDQSEPVRGTLETASFIGSIKDQGDYLENWILAVIHARTTSLNWKPGPDLSEWSLLEIMIDEELFPWVILHEYETDEYSVWAVGLDDVYAAHEVWRAPWKSPLGMTIFRNGTRVMERSGLLDFPRKEV